MGRRTWESLPPRFRPLPGRKNIVLTRDRSWTADGAVVVHDLESALVGDVWVMGGADVYARALPLASVIELTEVQESFAGDVYAPELGDEWQVDARDPAEGWHESTSGLHYRWTRLTRSP
jgi:dihydrofolate reductase